MKLEFAKLAIRTVVERIQADRKKKETSEEDLLNREIDITIQELAKSDGNHARLSEHLEELRVEKARLIEAKGERLAEKLGTKWYNEGEKSTKYFLRLLNRAVPDDIRSLKDEEGNLITDPDKIESLIVNFYKDLYETFEDITEAEDVEFFNNISKISGHDERLLASRIDEEELRSTLHSCKDSAPGPDGIPYSIIGLLWSSFGKILCNAWNYSLEINELPPSHKISYLKLIPKAGKELTTLANWRPISLSNCDHKLITKTYATRLSDKIAERISKCQTAYLKGRIINENIRSMIASKNLANLEEDAVGALMSLDAKKAFDSVSHEYIEKCLKSFGCDSFVKVFRLLYKDLVTDIIINGKITKGFKIKRGVKQGDSLSCIIFIMCMEPLLRNIESNPNIEPIKSRELDVTLPKAYGYADDINSTTKDGQDTIQAVFSEYERLSKQSGLVLNAEKTEIMRLGQNRAARMYEIRYMGKTIRIRTQEKIKINGVIFQNDPQLMERDNVDNAIKRAELHFKNWSRRSLSTLGKVFGIGTIWLPRPLK